MISRLKSLLRNTKVFFLIAGLKSQFNYTLWKWLGANTVPPPHPVKQRNLLSAASRHNIDIMVETGTYLGEMVWKFRNSFKTLYSIELNEKLYMRAKRLFRSYPHITILQGDSSDKLAELLKELDQPALFWLDGHFSGGFTSMADEVTPIVQELKAIFNSKQAHVIVIDDVRLFNGTGGYPTLTAILELVETSKTVKKYTPSIQHDALILEPEAR